MAKFISTKQLYTQLREVSENVIAGDTYIVLKHSKPAYKITPLNANEESKKYNKQDIDKFGFTGGGKNGKDLSVTYKDYLYK